MGKKKLKWLNWLLVAAALGGVAACNGVLVTSTSAPAVEEPVDVEEQPQEGDVIVRLDVAGVQGIASAARTVYPDVQQTDISPYVLKAMKVSEIGDKTTEEDYTTKGSWSWSAAAIGSAKVTLQADVWSFYLCGYKDDKVVVRGYIEEQDISANSVLYFTLSPITEGKGDIAITLNAPASISKVTAALEGGTPATLDKGEESGGRFDWVYAKSGVAAGDYRILFSAQVESGATVAVYSEVIWVRQNTTSRKTITIKEEDLDFYKAVPSLKVAATTSYTAGLEWDALPKAVQYEVWRGVPPEGEFTLLTTTTATATAYTDRTLEPLHTYYYQVYGVNANSARGSPSNVVTVTTPMHVPAVTITLRDTSDELMSGELVEVRRGTSRQITMINRHSASSTVRWYLDNELQSGATGSATYVFDATGREIGELHEVAVRENLPPFMYSGRCSVIVVP